MRKTKGNRRVLPILSSGIGTESDHVTSNAGVSCLLTALRSSRDLPLVAEPARATTPQRGRLSPFRRGPCRRPKPVKPHGAAAIAPGSPGDSPRRSWPRAPPLRPLPGKPSQRGGNGRQLLMRGWRGSAGRTDSGVRCRLPGRYPRGQPAPPQATASRLKGGAADGVGAASALCIPRNGGGRGGSERHREEPASPARDTAARGAACGPASH